MQIEWKIGSVHSERNAYGDKTQFLHIAVTVHSEGLPPRRHKIVHEDCGSDAPWPTLVRSNADDKITAWVLEDLALRLEEHDCERYEFVPPGPYTI